MSLYWACDEKCGASIKSYVLPDGWQAEPAYDKHKRFVGMKHTCAECVKKKREQKKRDLI